MPENKNPWMSWTYGWFGTKEREEFADYQKQGGGLGFNAWIRQGKPSPPTRVTALTKQILGPDFPPGAIAAPETPGERARRLIPPVPPKSDADRAIEELLKRSKEMADRPFPGQEGGGDIIEQPDGSTGYWSRDPTTGGAQWNQLTGPTTARPQAPPSPREKTPAPGKDTFTNSQGQIMTWSRELGKYVQTGFDQDAIFQPEPPQTSPYQEEQLTLRQREADQQQAYYMAQINFQQQQAQQQAELQRQQEMARLAANPINWLQYSAYTGQQPAVQPWMIPLGFQNTGGAVTPQGGVDTASPIGTGVDMVQGQPTTQAGQPLVAGQPIPGVQGTDYSTLPALRTPSAQLQARWGPTAQAQYLGYRRARTGASPQESQFRLGSSRAPAGRFQGFSRFR